MPHGPKGDQRGQDRRRHQRKRQALLDALGGKCVVCGFADQRALHIDHVLNDGCTERKQFCQNPTTGSFTGYKKYFKHIAENLDSGRYQLLCANCNTIKEYNRRHVVD
jgi:hypothetical protein